MVELPEGNIIEERRGGAGILATLVSEMIKIGTNGYIRCERTPTEAMPRVGQVIVNNGTIEAALHEAESVLEGVDALIEIESDCSELDCMLQLVEGIDTYRVLDLHPNARLNVEAPEENRSSKWWDEVSNRSTGWTKASRLPTIEASVEAPEFIQAKAAAMVHKHAIGGVVLKPGCVYSNESDSLFHLATNLKSHDKPLLVISRRSREELVAEFGLPAEDCLWLSQNDADGVQFVDIGAIKETVYEFLEGNLRAVLLLDGLEYLANICGSKEVIEMVRELGDRMRFEDDCLLISCDKNAWTKSESAQLMRAAPYLGTGIIDAWNLDSESLLDHPLMAPPTEEELLRLSEYLKANTPDSFVVDTDSAEDTTHDVEELPEAQELPVEVVEEETIMTVVSEEPVVEEVVSPNISKGPRTPQRMKRRKSKHPEIMDDRATRAAGLAAATEGVIESEMPTNKHLPKTVVGQGREVPLPNLSNVIPNELRDVVRLNSAKQIGTIPGSERGAQSIDAAAKNEVTRTAAISPVAARGIEVQRNVAKRSQASSVPQRKLDLEKELLSWSSKEEDL